MALTCGPSDTLLPNPSESDEHKSSQSKSVSSLDAHAACQRMDHNSTNSLGGDSIAPPSDYLHPDGGWGWVVVFGCFLGHVVALGLTRSLGIFYRAFIERYGQNDTATSWVNSLQNTSKTLFGPLVSLLCKRFSCRAVAIVGGVTMCVGLVLSAIAPRLLYLFFTFGLMTGIGSGLVFTAMYLMIAHYFDKRKGLAMGLATLGHGVGSLVLSPTLEYLFERYGHVGALVISGALMLHCCIAGALFRPVDSCLNISSKFTRVFQVIEVKGETVQRTSEANGTDGYTTSTDKEQSQWSLDLSNEPTVVNQVKAAKIMDDTADPSEKNLPENEATRDTVQPGVATPLSDTENSLAHHEKPHSMNVSNPEGSSKKISEDQLTAEPVASTPRTKHSLEIPREVKANNSRSLVIKCRRHLPLLFSPTFLLYGFNMSTMAAGIGIYLWYLPSLMIEVGCTRADASLVLTVSGASDILGRVSSGVLFDLQSVRKIRRPLHHGLGLLLAVIVLVLGYQTTFGGFMAVTLVWGVVSGGWHAQRATFISDIVPIDQVNNGVGFMIFFQGLGSLAWPSTAGFLSDTFSSYTSAYVLAAAVVFVSSAGLVADYLWASRKRPMNPLSSQQDTPPLKTVATMN